MFIVLHQAFASFCMYLIVHCSKLNYGLQLLYKDLGEFDWKSNYKGNKTRPGLRGHSTEGKRRVIKPSFRFKYTKCSKHRLVGSSSLVFSSKLFAQGLCGQDEQTARGPSVRVMRKSPHSISFTSRRLSLAYQFISISCSTDCSVDALVIVEDVALKHNVQQNISCVWTSIPVQQLQWALQILWFLLPWKVLKS